MGFFCFSLSIHVIGTGCQSACHHLSSSWFCISSLCIQTSTIYSFSLNLLSSCLLLSLSLIPRNIEQIKKLLKNGSVEHEISIFWVPRRTLVSNKILEEEGVLGDVNVSEFPMYFLPLEHDILSLELEDAFVEMYLVSSNGVFYLN